MRGTSAAEVMMNASFLNVMTYIRATVNTVTVGQAYATGSNSYLWEARITPV